MVTIQHEVPVGSVAGSTISARAAGKAPEVPQTPVKQESQEDSELQDLKNKITLLRASEDHFWKKTRAPKSRIPAAITDYQRIEWANKMALGMAQGGTQPPKRSIDTTGQSLEDCQAEYRDIEQTVKRRLMIANLDHKFDKRGAQESTVNTANRNYSDYQMQLMLLEQQNKKRLLLAGQEQDSTVTGTGSSSGPSGPVAQNDYQVQLMLLEQQNKRRLMMARQEQDMIATPAGTIPSPRDCTALQDYQMQLMLKEQQNKKRLMMAGQQNSMTINSGPSTNPLAPSPLPSATLPPVTQPFSSQFPDAEKATGSSNQIDHTYERFNNFQQLGHLPLPTPSSFPSATLPPTTEPQFPQQATTKKAPKPSNQTNYTFGGFDNIQQSEHLPSQTTAPHSGTYPPNGGNNALQDYQMQLMLLEHQNKNIKLREASEREAHRAALRDARVQVTEAQREAQRQIQIHAAEKQMRIQSMAQTQAQMNDESSAVQMDMDNNFTLKAYELLVLQQQAHQIRKISRASTAPIDNNQALQDYQMQLMPVRDHGGRKGGLGKETQEQDQMTCGSSTVQTGDHALSDHQRQFTVLEQENKEKCQAENTQGQTLLRTEPSTIRTGGNHALQEYQVQLMLSNMALKKKNTRANSIKGVDEGLEKVQGQINDVPSTSNTHNSSALQDYHGRTPEAQIRNQNQNQFQMTAGPMATTPHTNSAINAYHTQMVTEQQEKKDMMAKARNQAAEPRYKKEARVDGWIDIVGVNQAEQDY